MNRVKPDRRLSGTDTVLVTLLAGAALYTCHRALVVRVDYYDAYVYLFNAARIIDDGMNAYDHLRPPFLPLAMVPAVTLARLFGPPSVTYLVVPHLFAAVLSGLSAATVYWALRDPLGRTLALTGALVLVTTPLFVRYGALAMADVSSAGWAAAVIALDARARRSRTRGAVALVGLALGTAALTKYPLVALWPALLVSEGLHALFTRRVNAHRFVDLIWYGLIAGAWWVAVQAGLCVWLYGEDALGEMTRAAARFGPESLARPGRLTAFPGESPLDHVGFALHGLGSSTMLLAVLGVVLAAVHPEVRDLPFIAWLCVVGGAIVGIIGHTEARYLLPAVPPVLYFCMRAVERLVASAVSRWGPRARGALLAGVLVPASAGALQQAMRDRDPVFFADDARRAAAGLLAGRGPGGSIGWAGEMHCFHTRDPRHLEGDEIFDVFHFDWVGLAYLLDEPVARVLPDTKVLPGDVILRATDLLFTAAQIPPDGVPPPEIWLVRPSGRAITIERRPLPPIQ